MGSSHQDLTSDTGIGDELVASLFATRAPAAIMTLLFVMIGSIVARGVPDVPLRLLLAAGIVASVGRLATLTAGRRALADNCPPALLRRIERRFAISYFAFAGIFGTFCARAMHVAPVEHLVLIGILMTGYAAGVASGVTLRPRIAITAICLAAMPSALVMAMRVDRVGVATAIMLLAFLAGGLRSMQMRYRSETGRIALHRTYEQLAQQDFLTRIANRRGLERQYAVAAAEPGRPVVVHCLDLDGFKQINDLRGHDAGDTLLSAVAARLAEVPGGAIAARLGGDEFALIQFAAGSAEAAQRVLERRLSSAYEIDGVVHDIGVSIGTAIGTTDQPLRDLLHEADMRQRLRKLERRRQNRGGYGPLPIGVAREAALLL